MIDQAIATLLQKYAEWKGDSDVFEGWYEDGTNQYYLRVHPKKKTE